MPRFSVTLPESQAELIEDLAGEDGPAGSKSEAVRILITDAQRVSEVEDENDRLRRERRQLLEQRDEHGELVRWGESEREREQRRRDKSEQPVWTRAKWWVLGRPSDQ